MVSKLISCVLNKNPMRFSIQTHFSGGLRPYQGKAFNSLRASRQSPPPAGGIITPLRFLKPAKHNVVFLSLVGKLYIQFSKHKLQFTNSYKFSYVQEILKLLSSWFKLFFKVFDFSKTQDLFIGTCISFPYTRNVT